MTEKTVDYCAQIAQESRAILAGTAPQAEVWILLEYRGAWRAKAVEDNDLPNETQTWLETQTAQIDKSRIVFIRRTKQRNFSARLCCYIAVTREDDQRLYRFDFDSYEALEQLNISQIVAGKRADLRCEEKLVLVCTNGKRDRCCATFGRPVYAAFADEAGLSAWQATHLGGHRYAAVAAIFPAGVYYGYLKPETVPAVAEAVRGDEIYLPAYRGRVFYSGAVSAGDYFLRQGTRVKEVGVISAEITPENHHLITYESKNSRHVMRLVATMSEPVFVGCTANKFKPQPIYKVRQITHLQK